jgi:hypothetical protein
MEFNIDPYYDDFKENALDNNYMKVLFKPGKAVQARELTQIQSILQNQIKQFGDHVFQDGSPVIGGNMSLDNKCRWLKLERTYNQVDVDVADFEGRVIRNTAGNVQAKVLATFHPEEGEPTLMIRYVTGNEFNNSDVIKVAGETTEAVANSSNSSGYGTVVSINEGVFYADGYFVKVLDQTAVVSAYSSSANVKIGLEINEDIIDSEVDTTLLDPAQSSFNYQAPGADRFQFSLVLTTRPLDTVVDESKFFELMRVESGQITKQVKYPIYAELEKTLARRTYDESGDYTVKPFRASVLNGNDDDQYTIAIEPGKAYVKGFEFETIGTFKLDVDKPRSEADTRRLVETDVDISYGNYVYVTGLRGSSNGFINIAGLEKVDVHCVDTSQVSIGSTSDAANTYQNTKIGTARVKNFVRYDADNFNAVSDSNGAYQLYLSDVDMKPLVTTVAAASSNANTIRLPSTFSSTDNAYVNVTATILPIRFDALTLIGRANVNVNSFEVHVGSNLLDAGGGNKKVNVGDIIRVNSEVREVVNVPNDNTFIVNTEFTSTYTSQSSAYPLSVFKQTAYTSNVTNQTRTIVRYDGTTKTAFLDRAFDDGAKVGGAVANATSVVQLSFKIDHAEAFVSGPAVANTQTAGSNTSMNVSVYSKYTTGETSPEEPKKNALIFTLPRGFAKRGSINNCDYIHNKLIQNRPPTSSGSGIFEIAAGQGLVSGGFETLPWADSTSSIQDNLIVVVKDRGSETGVQNGDVLQLTSANITKTNDSLTIDTGLTGLLLVDILVNVKQNDAEDKIRRKILHSNTELSVTSFNYPTTTIGANTNIELRTPSANIAYGNIDVANGLIFITNVDYTTVRPGDSISLYTPDVVRVRKILAGNTTMLPNATVYTDVTNNFYIDYGQRDDRYDHTKLILKDGYNSPSAKLLVHVDFYQHIYATGTNVSFFSVDSYAEEQYDDGTIPVYTSSTGVVYNLRDCLDFRPTQILGDGDKKYTVPALSSPDETTELSYSYYLPRIDKLVLSKDKEFRVIKGKAAAQPLPPQDSDDAMTLYTLYLPPYVSDVRDIRMKYNENKRYTMKDISRIDKRLEKVEFFVSLNNVEKLALADKTEYEDGTEKEKYGIVGENFTNFNIVDYKSPDFNAALEGGFMIPSMKVYSLGLKPISNQHTVVNRKTVSLNYTEVPAITQGVASDKAVSVQPFLFGQFNGTLRLTPETDYWVSETLKPEIITVPEREKIITEVIREKIIVEPTTPPTVPPPAKTPPVIDDPGTQPDPTDPGDIVPVGPQGPDRPIIPDDPQPPPAQNNCNGHQPFALQGWGLQNLTNLYGGSIPNLEVFSNLPAFEPDPWLSLYCIAPIDFGVSFTSGVSGYSGGSLFTNGGVDKWTPAFPFAAYDIDVETPAVLPTAQPIFAAGGRGAESGGGGGGRFENDFLDFNYDRV